MFHLLLCETWTSMGGHPDQFSIFQISKLWPAWLSLDCLCEDLDLLIFWFLRILVLLLTVSVQTCGYLLLHCFRWSLLSEHEDLHHLFS